MSPIKAGDLVTVRNTNYPGIYFDPNGAYPVISVEGGWAMVKSKRGVALNCKLNELTNVTPVKTEEPRLTTAEYIAAIGKDNNNVSTRPLVNISSIRGNNPLKILIDELGPTCAEYTGGSVSYYSALIERPTNKDTPPYTAECNDIIEALGMNYAEGNAFKALWRMCAARKGKSKKGYTDGLYDAEKVVFFGNRLVAQLKAKA